MIMKKLGFLMVVLAVFIASAQAADAPNTRVTYPTGISAEILGRGPLWSVNFEQVVSEDFAVGFGYGQVGTEQNGNDTGRTANLLPVFMNYYLKKSGNSVFITGGANVVLNSKKVKNDSASVSGLDFPNDAILPTFGFGYESRTDTGFFFRATGYLLAGDSVAPWMGFTFGHAF